MSEHLYGASLSALEVAGAKSWARGEFISRPQDCFRRIAASLPGQLISRGRSETVLREEPLRPQSVVLIYRPQHVSTGHVIPGHHLLSSAAPTLAGLLRLPARV